MADVVSFERDIKPLFREMDREAMLSSFDLWDRDDVEQYHRGILETLENGSMPCDDPWLDEDVAKFRAWVDGGMAE